MEDVWKESEKWSFAPEMGEMLIKAERDVEETNHIFAEYRQDFWGLD